MQMSYSLIEHLEDFLLGPPRCVIEADCSVIAIAIHGVIERITSVFYGGFREPLPLALTDRPSGAEPDLFTAVVTLYPSELFDQLA